MLEMGTTPILHLKKVIDNPDIEMEADFMYGVRSGKQNGNYQYFNFRMSFDLLQVGKE